jgi:tape measure domain-containing protein
MADESVELEIELKDGVSKPAKRMAAALQRLAADASRTQTRVMQRNFRESTKGHKRYLDRQYKAAKQSAVASKRAAQIREAEGTAWTKLGGSISAVAGGIGMATGALVAMAAVSAGVVYGTAKLGGALIDSARSAGDLRFALGRMTGTDGRAALESSTRLAADLGLNIEETTSQYAKFLSLKFSESQSEELVKLGGDMQALGADSLKVQRIMTNIGKIKSQGKVQGDEIMSLAEANVPVEDIYKEVARLKGIKFEDVLSLQAKGGIDDETAIAAIKKAILTTANPGNANAKAGDAAADYVKSFSGSLKRGESTLQRVGLGLGSAFERGFAYEVKEADRMKKAGFTGLSTQAGAGGFFDQLKNSPVIEKLGGFVERLGGTFAMLLPQILAVGEAFVSGFTDGAGLADMFNDTDNVRSWAAVLRDDVVPGIKAVGSILGWASKWTLILTGGLAYLGAMSAQVFAAVLEGPARLVEDFRYIGEQVVDGFISGFSSAATRTKDAVTGWADGAVTWTKNALGIHSPSKEFAKLGKYSVQGYQQGLDSLTPELPSSSAMVPASLSPDGSSNSFSVVINVDGSKDPGETARMVRLEFESMFSGMMGRFAEGIA